MGPPVLKAYFERRGRSLRQIDLNVAFIDHLRSKLDLEVVENPGGQQRIPEVEDLLLAYFGDRMAHELLERAPYLESSVGERRDGSMEHYNREVGSGLGYPSVVGSTYDGIARFARDRTANCYNLFFDETRFHEELARDFDVVGISITGPSQLIASLTLSARLKEENPESRIVLGGPWATMFAGEIAGAGPLASLWDFVVEREGERPFFELVEGLGGGGVASIPNLWTSGEEAPREPEEIVVAETGDFGPASYDGLDLDRYRAPRPVLLQASRGCYWGRCAFCVHAAGVHDFHGRTRTRSIGDILAEIDHLVSRYSPRFLCFTDVSLSPKVVRGVSEGLLERGCDLPWYAFLRFEKAFDRELLALARSAGCFLLHFGLESGCEEVLERVDKGQDLQVARRILDDAADLGFRVTIHTMAGLPGETARDLEMTFEMIRQYAPKVHDSFTEIFRLERGTRIHRDPGRYGIALGPTRRIFDNAIDFENPAGLSSREAMAMVNEELYGFYAGRDDLIYRLKSMHSLEHRRDFDTPSVFKGRFDAGCGGVAFSDSVEVSTTGGGILERI